MRLNVMALIATGLLLAACSSAPETTGAGATGGTTTPATTSQPTTAAQPAGPAENSEAYFVANVGDRVFFAFDKYDVASAAQDTLRKQAAWLKKYPAVTATIEGHADERGTREYNLALGERRANAVRDFLVSQGVTKDRLKTISYGKERPVAMGHDEAAWSQNRRAVTVLTAGAPRS
jgi:peptidoglycan-associated lipoprotein